jgi:glutaminyl-peptide cyclotransferase
LVSFGRLAQLGERGVRNAEAEGSNPLPSIRKLRYMAMSKNVKTSAIVTAAILVGILAYGTLSKRDPLTASRVSSVSGGVEEASAQTPRPTNTSTFNADRAFADLRAMVAFGPRPAGSESLSKTRAYIVAELQKAGLKAELDEFEPVTPRGRKKMTNIRASHYDTKLFNNMTFVGANDGGSSAAWLLEMARITQGLRLQNTLEFVFFDGEEAVVDWTDDDSVYGSKHDVERRSRAGTLSQLKAVILVDMIGDKDLNILRESQSTGWLTETIWSTGRSIGYNQEFLNTTQTISDDHIPFLNARIPAVDIIDFDYGPGHSYWHQASDTLDKTSGRSLKVVGDAVYVSLPEIDRRASQ